MPAVPPSDTPSARAPHHGRAWPTVAVVLAVVVVLVAVAGLWWKTWRPTGAEASGVDIIAAQRAPGPTDDVAIVGDSITQQGTDALLANLGPRWNLSIRALGGQTIGQMQRDAEELADTRPEQVIINLGSNDVLKSVPFEVSADDLDTMLSTFLDTDAPPRCVHLVNVNAAFYYPSAPGLDQRIAELNAEIARQAQARGADVIDWSGHVAAYDASGAPDGPITVDTVHPSLLGHERLDALYDAALASCTSG